MRGCASVWVSGVCLWLLVFVCVVPFCAWSYSTLKVIFPQTLVNSVNTYTGSSDGHIPEYPALFGQPNYGYTLTRPVYISNANDGCSPIDALASGATENPVGGGFYPFFLLINRGACNFTQKVLNAQTAGAVGVIMANIPTPPNPPQPYGYGNQLVYMADSPDHLGAVISIPSMLIGITAADYIRSAVSSQQVVLLSMSFLTYAPDNRTEWELWTSSYNPNSDMQTFYDTMGAVVTTLKDRALFTPHYVTFPRAYFSCPQSDDYCNNQCSKSNRCVQTVVYNQTVTITGLQIIKEDIRQLCVYNSELALNSQTVGQYWFLYAQLFQQNCVLPPVFTDDCANAQLTTLARQSPAFQSANLPWITTCVATYGYDKNPNDLLTWESQNQTVRWNSLTPISPSLFINNDLFTGSILCPGRVTSTCSVVDDICNGYAAGSAPPACVESDCSFGVFKDECGVCGGNGAIDHCNKCLPRNSTSWNSCMGCDNLPYSGKVVDACGVCGGDSSTCSGDSSSSSSSAVTGIIIALVVGAVLFFGVVAYFIYRQRRRMKADVNVLLQQYVPLADNVGPASGARNNTNAHSAGRSHFPPRHGSDPDRASLVAGSASTSEEDL